MRSALMCVVLLGLRVTAETQAEKRTPSLPPQLESVQCAELGPLDYDGDGVRDLACITREGEQELQRLTVVLSGAPAGAPPALDIPLLHCPGCQGVMPNSFELAASQGLPGTASSPAQPGSVRVSETGGSNSLWTHDYLFEQSDLRFYLRSENHGIHNRNDDTSGELNTYYEAGVATSVRRASPEEEAQSGGVEFLDIYALPRKGPIKVEGRGRESAWRGVPKVTVRRNKYSNFEKLSLETETDLAFELRALWDEQFLYLLIEVTDDSVVLAPAGRSGVRYDHLELWTDASVQPWEGEFVPRMEPAPKTTAQFGLIPLRGSKKVKVMRWYPDETELPWVEAAYLSTPKGYTVEVRLPLELLTVSSHDALDLDQRGLRKGFVNLTVIASDSDSPTAPRQESMIATSQLEHRGAPFEFGLLHLMKLATPESWRK